VDHSHIHAKSRHDGREKFYCSLQTTGTVVFYLKLKFLTGSSPRPRHFLTDWYKQPELLCYEVTVSLNGNVERSIVKIQPFVHTWHFCQKVFTLTKKNCQKENKVMPFCQFPAYRHTFCIFQHFFGNSPHSSCETK